MFFCILDLDGHVLVTFGLRGTSGIVDHTKNTVTCQILVAPVAPSLENVVSSQVAQANPHRLGKL